ncbi:MAG: hypothetical protein KBD53_08400 [Candidatus Omnitrophica bacterium]|nr:hypothetical protein [Candidatus Omnitrophota bacterium]
MVRQKFSKKSSKRHISLKQLFIFVCIVFLVGIIKNFVLKEMIIKMAPKAIGCKIQMNHFSLNLLTQKINIQGLIIFNPKGFPSEPFLTIPEITVKTNVWGLLRGQLHLPLVIVNMRELVVIKNKDKKLNVDALSDFIEHTNSKNKNPVPSEKSENKIENMAMSGLYIEVLKLNVDRVIYKDFSHGITPIIKVYDVGLKNKTIRNIHGVNQLITYIVVQAMGATAIKGAGIYAAAAIMGAGFLPVGVLGLIVAKDDSAIEMNIDPKEAFDVCLKFAQKKGKLKKQNRLDGIILAKINGYDVKFKIKKMGKKKTKIVVTVRKMMIPKPEMAGGFLYQIEEMLNQRR